MTNPLKFESPVELYYAVKNAWSPETVLGSFDPANPCRNQCAVTALAVQHYFGGEIIKTATRGGTHFYNQIAGRHWDLATDQFNEPIPYDNMLSTKAEALTHATQAHMDFLLANIEASQLAAE